MKKFLVKIMVSGFIVFLLLNIVSFFSLFFLEKSNFYKQQFVVNGVSESSFDYVVLGSSTGLTTLDTKVIDSVSGLNGLNISMDDSALGSHYLMLQHFYGSGKKTNKLVLTVTPWDMGNDLPEISDNDYRFLPHIQNKEVFDYFEEINEHKLNVYTLSKYFPIVGVSYFNTEIFYPSLVSAYKPNQRNRFDDKGNYSYPVNTNVNLKDTVLKKEEIIIANPYYYKIQEFCNNNKIELIIYISPMYNRDIYLEDSQYFSVVNHSYIFKDDSKYFYDNIHVNNIGRFICSAEFAKRIIK